MTKQKPAKIHYPMFSQRVGEDVQESLKEEYLKSEKSWHLFLKDMLALYKKYNKRDY